MMKRLGSILPILLIVFGCGQTKKTASVAAPATPAVPNTAIRTIWDLKKLVADDASGTGVFLIFTDSSHVNGYGGCNIFTATSGWTGNRISFSNLVTKRKKVCDSNNIEHKVFSFLPQIDEVRMVNNTLQLYKSGVVIMDFEARVVVDEESDQSEK